MYRARIACRRRRGRSGRTGIEFSGLLRVGLREASIIALHVACEDHQITPSMQYHQPVASLSSNRPMRRRRTIATLVGRPVGRSGSRGSIKMAVKRPDPGILEHEYINSNHKIPQQYLVPGAWWCTTFYHCRCPRECHVGDTTQRSDALFLVSCTT